MFTKCKDVLKNGKPWFSYINEWLYKTTSLEQNPTDDLEKLFLKVFILHSWCYYKEPISNNLIHVTYNYPCGIMHIAFPIKSKQYQLFIKVPDMFNIHLQFKIFEMDISVNCKYSSMTLFELKNSWTTYSHWKFCGHMSPWQERTHASILKILIKQLYILKTFKLRLFYEIDNKKTSFVNIYLTKRSDVENILQVNEPTYVFYITGKLGYGITLSKFIIATEKSEQVEGTILLYEGTIQKILRKTILLNTVNDTRIVQTPLYFQYFCSSVIISMDLLVKKTIDMKFIRRKLQSIDVISAMHIYHKFNVFQAVYLIKHLPEKHKTLYFKTRAFYGSTSKNCNLGGYAIEQSGSSSIYSYMLFGPFCSPGRPGQPFISGDGLQKLVLPSTDIFLIFYAFDIYYFIDIDVIVQLSLCEGLIELNSFIIEKTRVVTNFSTIIYQSKYKNVRYIYIVPKKCIILNLFSVVYAFNFVIVVKSILLTLHLYKPNDLIYVMIALDILLIGYDASEQNLYLYTNSKPTIIDKNALAVHIIYSYYKYIEMPSFSLRVEPSTTKMACTDNIEKHYRIANSIATLNIANVCGRAAMKLPREYNFIMIPSVGNNKYILIYFTISLTNCDGKNVEDLLTIELLPEIKQTVALQLVSHYFTIGFKYLRMGYHKISSCPTTLEYRIHKKIVVFKDCSDGIFKVH